MSCSRGSGNRQLVSTDTDVKTQITQNSNGTQTKVITTTTKKTYSDGSWASNTETQTITESNCARRQVTSSCPLAVRQRADSGSSSSSSSDDDESKSKEGSKSSDADESDFTKFELEALRAHNDYRKKHGAPPLKLSRKICQVSQNWVNYIANAGRLQHSSGSGYGENLYMSSGSVGGGKDAVKAWYDEIHQYNFNNQGFSSGTGHFTQVVWKSSTELGIAKATGRNGTYVCANYSPPGNFQGQYPQNVARPQ